MTALLEFFSGGPARIQALLISALVAVALLLATIAYGLWWRGEALQARGELKVAQAQVQVVSEAAKACSTGVDHAKRAADAAVEATGKLAAAADRLSAPAVHTIERIERVITQPMTAEQAADCNWGWSQIELDQRKAGGP